MTRAASAPPPTTVRCDCLAPSLLTDAQLHGALCRAAPESLPGMGPRNSPRSTAKHSVPEERIETRAWPTIELVRPVPQPSLREILPRAVRPSAHPARLPLRNTFGPGLSVRHAPESLRR